MLEIKLTEFMKIKFSTIITIWAVVLAVLAVSQVVFGIPGQVSLPTKQTAVAAADLNNDGKPDLIIGGDPLDSEYGKIRVLLGNGDGTFQTERAFTVGFLPDAFPAPFVREIKIGDLNNDGNLDVVVAHNNAPSIFSDTHLFVTILLGTGDGNLRSLPPVYFYNNSPPVWVSSIDLGDVDGDGDLDVIIGCSISSVHGLIFFLKNLDGSNFQPMGGLPTQENIYRIAGADINNDKQLDLVMTTADGLLILYGKGEFFPPYQQYPQNDIRDAGIFEFGLTVKDFNGDGKPDIAVMDARNPKFHIFLNGQAGISDTPINYETNFKSDLLKSADINGDGNLDLVVSDQYIGNFQVFYGNGRGDFTGSPALKVNLPVSDYTFADFDLNGQIDIGASLYQNPPANQGAVFLNASAWQYRSIYDFDGDGKADISVFRPNNGVWYLLNSQAGFTGTQFGISTDKLVPADYDGDGVTDIAVYRSGVWYLQRSSLGFIGMNFGAPDDIPQPADYNGDGKADLAVFRPSNGTWYVLSLVNNQFNAFQFGADTDKPAASDYDGDGKADYAVYRPSNGTWYLMKSTEGFTGIQFGDASDKPVPADYDGDGKTDVAVFRPSNGTWYLNRSTQGFTGVQFGISTDLPTPADYDGDGRADIAVFRSGIWYLQQSTNGFTGIQFGADTDKPVPNIFIP